MRTSNKILLGVFLTAVIIFATIHVALYAKYKSGDFVTMKTVHEDEFTRQNLKSVHYVVASGLENFAIIPSDTLRLEIEKNEHGFVRYSIIGDSLFIHGDSTIIRADKTTDIIRSPQQVNLYLPSSEKITADYCELQLKASEDSSKAKSYHFELRNSTNFGIAYNDYRDSAYKYINSISIDAARSSVIEFSNYASINELKLKLIESQFDDKDSRIDKIAVDADKKSTITLRGENMTKLNMPK